MSFSTPHHPPATDFELNGQVGRQAQLVLIVDDDPALLRFLTDALHDEGYVVATARSRHDALAALRHGRVDALIADIGLPDGDGLDILREARRRHPAAAGIVMSGAMTVDRSIAALRLGADDCLLKPLAPDALARSLRTSLDKRRQPHDLRASLTALQREASLQADELRAVHARLQRTHRETLQALGAVLDARDIDTHAHSLRVATYALTLGRALGMDDADLTTLERGVYLHDIGKIGIPDRILLSPGALTPADWDVMRTHCELGYRVASRVEFLREAAPVILAHHERYDGAGYPRGLKGEAIPLGARLFAVIDALDAMTSDRPYRPARPFADAREEICRGSGSQFDPMIVEAFAGLPGDIWETLRTGLSREFALLHDKPA